MLYHHPPPHTHSTFVRGSVGLLFTNKSNEEVEEWFKTFSDSDFARSGFTAEESVLLDVGPLEQFPHNMEPQFRQLRQKGTMFILMLYCKVTLVHT